MLTLKEALPLTRRTPPPGARRLAVHLACGFTPLHLETFLHAALVQSAPDRAIAVQTGLFGDLCGNLERLQPGAVDVCVAQLEWSDLDSRLGLRSLGSWQPAQLPRPGSRNTSRPRRSAPLKISPPAATWSNLLS